MKAFILLFLSTLAFGESEVGWQGNSLSVGAINLKIQKATTITSDNTTVDAADNAIVTINSNHTNQANRTFVLAPGMVTGQKVVLVCFVAGTDKAELLDDSVVPGAGNHKLQGDWACIQKWDNIELQWSGNHWIERSRSDI